MMLRHRLLSTAGRTAACLHAVFSSRARGRAGALVYHSISPHVPATAERPYNVTPQVFRAQLTGLLARGFHFVRLNDLLDARQAGAALPSHSVVLSFDDAYESVYHHAFGVLRDLGVPATVFLATSFLDSPDPFPFDEWAISHRHRTAPKEYRPLRISQCREMADSGLVDFGAHTHTHQDFRGRPADLRRDLERSIQCVQDHFPADRVTFAFPFGRRHLGFAGGTMSQAARDAGACCALSGIL